MKALTLIAAIMIASTASAATFEQDTYKGSDGKQITITSIGHGSLAFTYDKQTIYIDPVGEYGDYSKLPTGELVLITHDHSDHLDLKTLEKVRAPKCVVIANPEAAKQIKGAVVLKNGEKYDIEKFATIEAVPAYNTTAGRDKFHPKGRDNGYILTLGKTRIYIAGDTEDIEEMKNLKNINIAFLPVNQPYTMIPEQAAAAAKVIKPKILYPYHYGDTDIKKLDTLLKGSGIEIRYRKLQ